ncbi:MAG: hypothetical protein C5B60_07845 [Chloroflexi bacterium]|nr:MAG: hypothetical protein C5B60_07845 [Chloroflexota bacterium]
MAKQNSGKEEDTIAHQLRAHCDRAISEALTLCDQADKASTEMVSECKQMVERVQHGTDEIRTLLREKMVEFGKMMQDYNDAVTAKSLAYMETTRQAIDMVQENIDAMKNAMKMALPAPKTETPVNMKLLGERLTKDDRI